MGLLDYLTRYSLRDLKARPTRTVLTILGITIGIAFMAHLTSLTLSMKTRVSEDVESLLGSFALLSHAGGSFVKYISFQTGLDVSAFIREGNGNWMRINDLGSLDTWQ